MNGYPKIISNQVNSKFTREREPPHPTNFQPTTNLFEMIRQFSSMSAPPDGEPGTRVPVIEAGRGPYPTFNPQIVESQAFTPPNELNSINNLPPLAPKESETLFGQVIDKRYQSSEQSSYKEKRAMRSRVSRAVAKEGMHGLWEEMGSATMIKPSNATILSRGFIPH